MKKIAIIGASYLQLPLVLKAKSMGIETHCFALEEGAVFKDLCNFFYPISVMEKDKILEICRKIKIAGITSISSGVAAPIVCYVSEKLNLISNFYESALIATDKYKMRYFFSNNGISSPKYKLISKNYSLTDMHFPLIVKPTDRSGSRGAAKVESEEFLAIAIDHAKDESFSKHVIIEEFIDGDEVSVETISCKGEHFVLSITDKVTTGEPNFVELEHHQPSSLSIEIQKKLKVETIKALQVLKIEYGASHAEFKIKSNGDLFILEIGARMGGDFIGSDLIPPSTGYDFVKGVIEISLGYFHEPQINKNRYSGVYFLSKETEHILPTFENIKIDNRIVRYEITNNQLNLISCSADRSGYFIYESESKYNL